MVLRVGRHSDVTSSVALASGVVDGDDKYRPPLPTATPTSPANTSDFKAKLLRMRAVSSIRVKDQFAYEGGVDLASHLALLTSVGAALRAAMGLFAALRAIPPLAALLSSRDVIAFEVRGRRAVLIEMSAAI